MVAIGVTIPWQLMPETNQAKKLSSRNSDDEVIYWLTPCMMRSFKVELIVEKLITQTQELVVNKLMMAVDMKHKKKSSEHEKKVKQVDGSI